MASLIGILGEIPDPRQGNARRHHLLDILTIALVASICGAESCVDFAEFAEDREQLLREFLGLENGLPSHDTFSRVFRLLDPEAFGRAFEAFLDDLGAAGTGVLAIAGQDPAPVVRPRRQPLAPARRHRLRHRGAGGDRAESRRRGRERDPRGPRASDDAHARRPAGEGRRDARPDRNRGAGAGAGRRRPLRAQGQSPGDAGGGRGLLRRPARALAELRDDGRRPRPHRAAPPLASHDAGWLFSDRRDAGEPVMPGLATFARVEAERTVDVRTSRAVRSCLSSARLLPDTLAKAVRTHRAIENSLHRVLDVFFDEDAARNRADNGPENLAILRRLTLNLLRKALPKLPVARKRKRAGRSDDIARAVIGQMRQP